MKRALAILTVLALVMAGCAKKNEETAKAAALVPTNALAYVSVSLDPGSDQKRNLQTLCGKFKELEKGDCGIETLLEALFGETGLDYAKDVKPWIGKEIAFAFLPPKEADGDPLAVLLIEAKDPTAAGDKLRAATKSGDLDMAYKIVKNYVVLDGNEKELAKADGIAKIEAIAAGNKASLGADRRFGELVTKAHDPRLVFGWWNLEQTVKTLGSLFPIPGFEEAMTQAEKEGGVPTVAFALYAENDAVALQGVAAKDKSSDSKHAGVPKITQGLPADTLAAITGFNVGPAIAEGLKSASDAGGDPAETVGDLVDQLRQETGIDLEQDVLSWMGGEFVLSLGKFRAEGSPDFGLVVEVTDQAKAAAGIGKVKAALEKYFEGPLTPVPVDGVTAYALPGELVPGLQPAMGLFPDRFVLASSPSHLAALSKPVVPGFGTTAEYHAAGSDKDRIVFQVVARLGGIRDSIVSMLTAEEKATYDKDVAPWVEPLKALLLRITADDAGFNVKVTTE